MTTWRATAVLLIPIVVLVVLSACGDSQSDASKKTADERATKKADLQTLSSPEVVALANGGAYVTSFHGPTWFVQGKNAVKVKGLPALHEVDEITPTADGGAYLTTFRSGIWRLDGDAATKIAEVPALASEAPTRALSDKERALFVLWQRESSKRNAAESEAIEVHVGRYDDDR